MPYSNGQTLAGGAAVAAAIGLLVGSAPAQALPPAPLAPADCAGYQFPGGTVSLNYPDPLNAHTEFDTIAGGAHVDTRGVTHYQQSDMPGTVIGDIKGTAINLKITREGANRDYPPLILKGDIGPDDRAHGTVTYKGGDPASWDSVGPMKCVPKPPPPAPQPAPEPVAQQPQPLAPDNNAAVAPNNNAATAPTQAQAPAPQDAVAPAPEQNQACIPDPFDLNFPGAC